MDVDCKPRRELMPDEKGKTGGDEDTVPDTSLHAYKDGRGEDVEGSIPSGDEGTDDVTPTGGATSGGPPREGGGDAGSGRGETADDTSEPAGGSGAEGLGTESGAAGGAESPSDNPDPSTKGATKGTEGAT
jgi:hypothetical protein